MLTLIQINKAVNERIISALAGTEFAAVPIIAKDIQEAIVRPSLKVGIENSVNGKFNSQCREKTLTIRVYFFAKDRYKYKMDNTKVQDLLDNAFLDGLFINGAYVPIESVNSEVTDTVLVVSFELYLIELLPNNDQSELVQEITFNI